MARYLKSTLRWVAGPAGGALYDLDYGRVYPVAPHFAAAVSEHARSGTALEELLGDDPVASAWLATLAAEGLLTHSPTGPRPPLHAVQPQAPKLIWLELTGRCNYTCVHCYADSDPTPTPTLPTARWLELIAQARAAGFPAIQFTGGDPLMHPHLLDFVAAAHAHGFPTVEVYTNGSLIQARHVDLFAAKGTHVAMSFYSWNPETYNAIVRQPRGHERAVAAIQSLLAHKVPLRIGLIEMDLNRHEITATREFLIDLGVDPARIHIDAVRPAGRGTDLASRCGTSETGRAAFVSLAALTGDTKVTGPIWQAPMPLPQHFRSNGEAAVWNSCWAGELVVDPQGDVYPCIFARTTPLANVAHAPLAAALGDTRVHAAWETNLGDATDCEICAYRYACFDCRALTINVSGQARAKPPSCIYDPRSDRMEWTRWLHQLANPAAIAATTAVMRRGDYRVVAETDDGVTVAAYDATAVATLPYLAAAVLDAADGVSVAEIAARIAAARGEHIELWLGPALMAAWELEHRGLASLTPLAVPT